MMAARNGKRPRLTKEFAHTDCKIKHPEVVSSGIFGAKIRDKHPRGLTKQASITSEEAMEVYIVEAVAKSHW